MRVESGGSREAETRATETHVKSDTPLAQASLSGTLENQLLIPSWPGRAWQAEVQGAGTHWPCYHFPTGQGRPFYQWSRAVQIRTNLDLVLDWLQGAGLGDIATEFFRKLSMAVNLLCVPRTSLLKVIFDP